MAGLAARARSLPRFRLPVRTKALGGRMPSRRRVRNVLGIAAVVALALTALYMLWLRNSSLVAVEEVQITGLETRGDLDASLRAAALEQTTLNVDTAALLAAISSDPAVLSLSADPDFPSALAISVELRSPVAYLPEQQAVVAADGVVLDRAGKAPEGVATVETKGLDGVGAETLAGPALELTRVLGAAPGPLSEQAVAIGVDKTYGIVVELDAGIDLRFGSAAQPEAKWKAAAAVLADPSLDGASYIDLSVPARPVAGGLDPASVTAPETATETEAAAAAAEVVPADPDAVVAAPAEPAPATDPTAAVPGAEAQPVP